MNWLRRFLTLRIRARRKIRFWYHPEYEPHLLAEAFRSVGLTPDRIDLLLGKLIQSHVIRDSTVYSSPLAGFDDLRKAHTSAYLEAVADPKTVSHIIGMEVSARESDQILRSQRRAVGGTIAAAEAAVNGDVDVAFNLGGGFHHAEADRGMGFCVFNDVAVAIRHLRAKGFTGNIAIIDLDFHQGNGNLAIFEEDPTVLTYSLHGAVWDPRSATSDLGVLLNPGTDDTTYIRQLTQTLMPTLQKFWPRLVFYIAGNDVLAGDRLGNFNLTEKGVLRRDKRVIRCIEAIGAKTVVVLGGGYSPLAWRCTANFIAHLRGRRTRPGLQWEPDLRARFTEISKSLEDPAEFSATFEFTEAEILKDIPRLAHRDLLLEHFSLHGIEFAFEKYGILEKIRHHGFQHFHFEMNISDPDKQLVRLYGRRELPQRERLLLLETVLRKIFAPLPGSTDPKEQVTLLDVNWLLIQDPDAAFRQGHPRLPGQDHPGLGIAEDVRELLVQMCRKLGWDGVSGSPSHFHNAAVASRWFKFLDPAAEGRFLAIRQAVIHLLVPQATQAVENGRLRLRNGSSVRWTPGLQILPVSPRLQNYFQAPSYHEAVQAECQRLLQAGLHSMEEHPG